MLDVADGEYRALFLACAQAGEEFVGQRRHHLPLLGIGVLRLVDQDMVEAAVELEQHPRREARTVGPQQIARLVDEIVVIELDPQFLGLFEGMQDRAAETQQRRRRLGGHHRAAMLAGRRKPHGFGGQRIGDARVFGCHGFRRQRFARRLLLGKELPNVWAERSRTLCRIRLDPAPDRRAPRLVGLFRSAA